MSVISRRTKEELKMESLIYGRRMDQERQPGQTTSEMGKYSIEELHSMYHQFSCQCDETGMYDQFLLVERAEGLYVWFKGETEPYLDLVMGFASLNLGHRHPRVMEATEEAIRNIDYIHSFNSESKILLSKVLAEKAPGSNNKKVYFPVGGAMAVETSIKLARAFTGKTKIASFSNAFHGYSYGGMMVTDDSVINKQQYAPYPGDVIRLPYAYCYRCDQQAQCNFQCLRVAEQYLSQDKDIAGLIIEPVQGHAGFIVPPREFIVGLRRLCQANNILFIDDEIQVGMGRTGRMFAIEHSGVEPDIILLSKSLAGGYYPLSAVIARADIWDCISPLGSGIGSTFVNSPLATYIALQVQGILEQERSIENADRIGDYFTRELKRLEKYQNVDNVTGLGLTQSFEIVRSKETKEPAPGIARKIRSEGLKQKVIINVAGTTGSRIKLTLPLWVNKAHIDMIMGKLQDIIESVCQKQELV